MRLHMVFAVCAVGFMVSGCVSGTDVSRNATLESPLPSVAEVAVPAYTVRDVVVTVPASLTTTEQNGIKPRVDVVWHGDPAGNRLEQLRVLFEEAASLEAEKLRGTLPVVAEITLTKFHGLTPRTRYSFRGDYDIHYTLTVKDAATGAVIEGPRPVVHILDAMYPEQVIATEAQGYTERMFVMDYLKQVLAQDLTH